MALSGPKKDIKVTALDALEFEPLTSVPVTRGRGWRLALVLIVVGGGAAAWSVFGDKLDRLWAGSEPEVQLIKALPGPVKVRPDNPGGLRVPDRDKLVYDRMQGGSSNGEQSRGPERLLPAPEQPLPRPGTVKKPAPEPRPAPSTAEKLLSPSPPKTPAKPKPQPQLKPVAKVPTIKDVKTAKRPPPPPPPPQAPTSETAPKQVAAPKPAAPKQVAAPKPAAPKPAAPKPAPTKVAKVAPAKPAPIARSRNFLVQLAAARSLQGARDEWSRLRTKNLDLLGNLGLTVTKADLGPAKGIFYRLRAGPLSDESSARSLCKQLAERKIGCLIIKPGS